MRRAAVETNATARALQLGALLLVGACVLSILVYDMGRDRPVAGARAPDGAGPAITGLYLTPFEPRAEALP